MFILYLVSQSQILRKRLVSQIIEAINTPLVLGLHDLKDYPRPVTHPNSLIFAGATSKIFMCTSYNQAP